MGGHWSTLPRCLWRAFLLSSPCLPGSYGRGVDRPRAGNCRTVPGPACGQWELARHRGLPWQRKQYAGSEETPRSLAGRRRRFKCSGLHRPQASGSEPGPLREPTEPPRLGSAGQQMNDLSSSCSAGTRPPRALKMGTAGLRPTHGRPALWLVARVDKKLPLPRSVSAR